MRRGRVTMIRFKRQPLRARPDTALAIVFSFVGPALAVALQADLIAGTASGKVYHTHPDCASLKKIAPENRVTFASVAMAEREGRRLCKTCEKLHARENGGADGKKQVKKEPTSTQPGASDATDGGNSTARVVKVLSGGTLVLDNGEKAVLQAVGIPLKQQEMARECHAAMSERALNQAVGSISREGVPIRDAHGRLKVHIIFNPGEPELGAVLISEGLAWAEPDVILTRIFPYDKAEAEAWEKGKGIWKRIEGPAGQREVLVGRFARNYHPVNCRHEPLLIEPARITINEAKARRLVPCDRYQMPKESSDATVSKSTRDKGTHEEEE